MASSSSSLMVGSKRRSVSNRNGGQSEGAVDLPLDIIFDIMSRLPIESIMRCRVVCKTWYGLTQDPHFINLQLSRTNNQPARFILQPFDRHTNSSINSLLLLDIEESKTRQIPIEEMQLNAPRIMCSCNGLLCIASETELFPVFICNPITGECLALMSKKSKQHLHVVSHWVGLGFDSSSGKYKVVRAYKFMNKHEVTRFEILTMGESKWRKLSFPRSIRECHLSGVVSWNGGLYWRISRKVSRSGRECILAFDLSDEKFQTISFPPKIGFRQRDSELVVLDECLTLIEHEENMMNIWKVTGNKAEGFSISCQQTYDTNVRWGGAFCYAMICRSINNSFLLQVNAIYERLQSHFVHFFPDVALYKPQYNQLDIPGLPDEFRTLHFKPSLVSPKAIGS